MEIDTNDYLGFVRSIANNFENTPRCGSEDYVNIGLLALENAAADYRPDQGAKFITFARPYVRHAIAKEFQATKNVLSGITAHKYNNNTEVKEIADKTNNRTLSLNAHYKEDTSLGDIIASGAAGPEATASSNEIGCAINEMIMELPDTYKEIVRMRLIDGETFEFIANSMGTTKNTIAGRYGKSLILLQAESHKRGLSAYLHRY